MLSRYLFERSDYARRLAADTSLPGRQRRLAVYQFLQFAYEQRRRRSSGGTAGARGARLEDPKRSFLRFVRRLAMVGDDTQLRQVPEWAASIDAVRLMTVHASKGLEFPVVYVPMLGAGIFPAKPKWNPCPLPPALLGPDRDATAEHEREEECLFFVAISHPEQPLEAHAPTRPGSSAPIEQHDPDVDRRRRCRTSIGVAFRRARTGEVRRARSRHVP